MSGTMHEQNARIAKLIGYRVEPRRNGHYALVLPNGVSYPAYLDEKSAWQSVPKYASDLNALWSALRRLNDDNHRYVLEVYDTGLGDNMAVIRDMIADNTPLLTWRGHDDDNVAQAAANALEALLVAQAKEAGRE